MEKRICDLCSKDIDFNLRWRLFLKRSSLKSAIEDVTGKEYDLCDDCYERIVSDLDQIVQ